MNWISVKTSLPEIGVTVIVAWPGHSTVGYYHADGNWYPGHPAPYDIPVTHWMALPEPPETSNPLT